MGRKTKRTVTAKVGTDSKGSVLWVAIPDAIDANECEHITSGPVLERGQREVEVELRVESPCFDIDEVMDEIRAKVDRKEKPRKAAKKEAPKGRR